MPEKKFYLLRISSEIYAEVKKAAIAKDRSAAWIIVEAIKKYLNI